MRRLLCAVASNPCIYLAPHTLVSKTGSRVACASHLPAARAPKGSRSVPNFLNAATVQVVAASNRRSLSLKAAAEDLSMESIKFPKVKIASEATGKLVAIGVYEEDLKVEGGTVEIASHALKDLNAQYGDAVVDILEAGDFRAKAGSSNFVRENTKTKFLGLVGLGKREKAVLVSDWGNSVYQTLGDQLASVAKSHKVKTVSLVFASPPKESVELIAGKIAMGAWLGGYEITRFKAEPKISPLEELDLVLGCSEEEGNKEISKAETIAKGVYLARSLVESPANICSPQYIADAAKMVADEFPDVMKLQILEREECEKRKMGCYLAVARASDFPPKFIHMTYTPKDGVVKKKIALVGKGLSFDSGGYSIKTSMMEHMKLDMGGAAATLGAARILGALQPQGIEVHFIVAACENMISGGGYRPGDVITASNGKTVEVINTDAEGRLTLADALLYAQDECGATTIVESSTLTGACIVGLGTDIAAVYSVSDKLADSLLTASKEAGEKLWRMPLEEAYAEGLKSPIADLKNTGGRFGGSITAGLFLKEFVDTEKVEFAHIDMAGPVFKMDSGLATGYGAAFLARWAGNEALSAATT